MRFCRRYKKFAFNEIKPEMLAYLHNTTLAILKEIVKILNANGIKYVLTGGTLLGAVTRKGFIPWDEDIDIAVFSQDYEKMTTCLLENLPSWITVQCNKTEKGYYHEWIKVRDNNSEIFPQLEDYANQGVWVDVYKITQLEKRELDFVKAKQHKDYLKRRLKAGKITHEEFSKRLRENKLNSKIFWGFLKKIFSRDTEEIYLIGTASKPMIEKKYVFPLRDYIFENSSFTSFNNAEAYLFNHYGPTWKDTPPEEDRYITIQGVKFK